MLNLLIFGPPGSGKGTQAGRLADRYQLHAISTGELLRKETAACTQLGVKIADRLASGDLTSDEIVTGLLARELVIGASHGFIFDGYPRTGGHARSFTALMAEHHLTIDAVFVLVIDDDLLIDRISGRLMCAGCGKSYHDRFNPPPPLCCPPGFTRRPEDNADALRVRLNRYHTNTRKVLNEFEQHPEFHTIDASLSMDEVASMINQRLDKMRPI